MDAMQKTGKGRLRVMAEWCQNHFAKFHLSQRMWSIEEVVADFMVDKTLKDCAAGAMDDQTDLLEELGWKAEPDPIHDNKAPTAFFIQHFHT